MRILLDESLPKDLAGLIAGHEVTTVRATGWSSFTNGKLLAAAASAFDVFLTADKNLEHQQNVAALPVAVVVLRARSNRVPELQRLLPELHKLLNHIQPRTLHRVGD